MGKIISKQEGLAIKLFNFLKENNITLSADHGMSVLMTVSGDSKDYYVRTYDDNDSSNENLLNEFRQWND